MTETAGRPLVSGWLPSWDLSGSLAAVEANADLMTEVSPFWFSAKVSGGSVKLSGSASKSQRAAAIKRLRAKGVRIIPSVADASSARAMAGIIRKASTRTKHARQLVTLVVDEGYDGIELDYERFAFYDGSSTWAKTRPAWVAFIRELAAGLHAKGKRLAVAAPPIYNGKRDRTSGYWVYDYAGMAPHVDSLRIMTYDWSVSSPGPIAPLAFAQRTLTYATAAFPANRIRMGMPAYGRLWVARTASGKKAISGTCPTGTPTATKSFTTDTALDFLTDRNGGTAPTTRYDTTAGEAVTSFSRTFSGKTAQGKKTTCTVTYEAWWMDARGVARRLPLVRQYQLAGFAFWHLGGVDPATWAVLRGRATTARTTVTLTSAPATPLAKEATTLTARVAGGVPAGTRVVLDTKAYGAKKWTRHSAAGLTAAGQVSFRVSASGTTSWRVRVPATPGHTSASATVKVKVVPRVTAKPSTSRPTPGSKVTVTVQVTPSRKGMKVRRQVLRGDSWETLATAKTTKSGKATFTITWPQAPTTLTYRIRTGKKGALAAGGVSPRFTLRTR